MTRILTGREVAGYAYEAGFRGDSLVTAVAVAHAESSFDAENRGDTTIQDGTWGPSVGLWQIRSLKAQRNSGKERDEFRLDDPSFNARSAYSISQGGTNWRPWCTAWGDGACGTRGGRAPSATSPAPGSPAADYLEGARRAVRNRERDPSSSVPDSSSGTGGTGTDGTGGHAASGRPIQYLAGAWNKKTYDLNVGGRFPGRSLLSRHLAGGEIDMTAPEISKLSLRLYDSGQSLIRSNRLGMRTPIRFANLIWLITGYSISAGPSDQPMLTLDAQPAGVVALRFGTPLRETDISPTDYMAHLANQAGLDFRGEQSAVRSSIGPATVTSSDPLNEKNRLETGWEIGQRLAKELGYLFYEAGGILFFGRPESFYVDALPLHVTYRGGFIDRQFARKVGLGRRVPVRAVPNAHANIAEYGAVRKDPTRTGSVSVDRETALRARPGRPIYIDGLLSDIDGLYTITGVNVPLDDAISPGTITWGKLDPPAATSRTVEDMEAGGPGGATTGQPDGTTGSALDFVTFCLNQVGDSYVYGASPSAQDDDPDSFDCSSLVQWAAAQVDVTLPRTSAQQNAYCRDKGTLMSIEKAKRTRGALLFIQTEVPYHHHIVVSLGDGVHTIEAMGSAYGVVKGSINHRGWTAAAYAPGMNYGTGPATRTNIPHAA